MKFRKNRTAVKHRLYAAVITALILAAVILVNILTSVIGKRLHTTLDLTAEGRNSVTRENIEYIRGVNKPVTVTVCASEEGYTGEYMAYFAANSYMAQDTTGQYYGQTLTLLREYAAYNNKIEIVFADPQTPAFAQIQSRYPGADLAYGDILIECSFEVNGETVNRSKILKYTDIYELEYPAYAAYFGGYQVVSGSRLETALTSAIYAVTAEKTTNALLINRGSAADTSAFVQNLELNNYAVSTAADGVLRAIPEGTDLLAIVAPTADFAPDELKLIEDFLASGHGLLYFASTAAPELPRLNAFLEEWGITLQPGILYETNENYRLLDIPTQMALANKRTDYTADINGQNIGYAAGNLLPMALAYETYQSRTASVLMATSESVVAAALNAAPEDTLPRSSYPVAVLTRDSADGGCVAAFAGDDFLSGRWDQYATIDNMRFVLTVAGQISGAGSQEISLSTRVVASGAFDKAPSQAAIQTVRTIFVRILPAIALIFGFVVWFRRRNL